MARISTTWSPEDWARLGDAIRKSRGEQGLSRKKLSELSGISEKSIQITEEGRVPTRWPKSLDALEVALGWVPGLMMKILDGVDPSEIEREGIQGTARPPAGGSEPRGAVTSPGLFPASAELREGSALPPRVDELGVSRAAGRAFAPAALESAGRFSVRDSALTSRTFALDLFVQQMRRYRLMQDVSRQELAARAIALGGAAYLDERHLGELESGEMPIKGTDAEVLARALGTSVNWLAESRFRRGAPEELRAPLDEEEMEVEARMLESRLEEAETRLQMVLRLEAEAKDRADRAKEELEYARRMEARAAAERAAVTEETQYIRGRLDMFRATWSERFQPSLFPEPGEDK